MHAYVHGFVCMCMGLCACAGVCVCMQNYFCLLITKMTIGEPGKRRLLEERVGNKRVHAELARTLHDRTHSSNHPPPQPSFETRWVCFCDGFFITFITKLMIFLSNCYNCLPQKMCLTCIWETLTIFVQDFERKRGLYLPAPTRWP